MLDKNVERQMREEAKAFGIQPGFKVFSLGKFSGMNQTGSARQDGEDQEVWWQENWIKTGDYSLRTMWDKGQALYSAPGGKTIIYFTFYNIGLVNYAAVFLSDGTAVQVNTATGAVTTIASVANTFYNMTLSLQLPATVQWGSSYLLISNNFASNNYWVWDGINLYTSGTISPLVTVTNAGSGYTSPPTITAFGGAGSSTAFTGIIKNGALVGVSVNSPGVGYGPFDQVQLYITGGGTDSGFTLRPTLNATVVQSVLITNAGSGYAAGTYSLGFTGGGGASVAGTYTVDATGTVVTATLTNQGTGYTDVPLITFPSGGGTGASGVAFLAKTSVASVVVVNGGTNLTGTPTLSFVGGGGTGATATATVTSGVISSVAIGAGGSGYTSRPACVVQTGLNNVAAASITLMPFGVSGTSMEVFNQRVWLGHPFQPSTAGVTQTGSVFNVSAPGSFSDYATSDGAVGFTSSDAFLKYTYVNFKQSNGYLYAFGDSSVSVISNVQASGVPVVTTFNYQNSDPQTGVVWRDSLIAYSRAIVFGNLFGVYRLDGGAVTRASTKINNIFQNAVFPANGGVTPTSAIANMFSLKIFLMNMTVTDPFTNTPRNVLISWDETNWFIASQSVLCTFISSQEINSNMYAWGTDGTNLFPMFNTPSSLLTKKLSSKLYGQNNFLIQKESVGVYFQAQDVSVGASGISFSSVNVDSETGTYPIPQIPVFPTGKSSASPYYPIVSAGSGDIIGCNLGMTLTTSAKDMVLNYCCLGYMDVGSVAMSSTLIQGQTATE